MITEKRTLLTVITEAAIEHVLIKDMDKLAIKGYTISDARGKGSHGVRDASWEESSNIRLEVICSRAQAEQLLAHLQEHYYSDYSMVSFLSEIEVMRPTKF